MNPLDSLFGQIAGQIQRHGSRDTPGPEYDTNSILDVIGGIFGQHAQQRGEGFGGYNPDNDYANDNNYYGDNYGGRIASSDEDPYGDPGLSNQQGTNAAFGNIASSDEDPYGDPGAR
jgi:hypothetical protein